VKITQREAVRRTHVLEKDALMTSGFQLSGQCERTLVAKAETGRGDTPRCHGVLTPGRPPTDMRG